MSIHVCSCMHHGVGEWHLRYPGMSQEAAQGIADKINSGMLDGKQADRIAALEADLAAKEAECERLRVDVERLDYLDHHGRDVVFGIGYGDSADAWCVRTASIGFVKCANLRVAIDAGRKEGAK